MYPPAASGSADMAPAHACLYSSNYNYKQHTRSRNSSKMKYAPPASESPAQGTQRILQQLLDNIAGLLDTPPPLADDNIHEIRKTCKRLRALLRMARPGLPAGKYRRLDRKIRSLARHLSGLRDNRVMLDTLDSIARHFSPLLAESALAPVRESLQLQIDKDSKEAARTDRIVTLVNILDDIREQAGKLDTAKINHDTLIAGMTACYRQGRHDLSVLDTAPDTENAHALRKQAKYLYFQLGFISDWNDAAISPEAVRFNELEAILGSDHDLAVLVETVTEQPQLCPGKVRTELLLALAESRRVALLTRAQQLATGLYCNRPGKFRRWLKSCIAQPL